LADHPADTPDLNLELAMHVFTYGSLMFAPVWERVVKGRYRSAPAHAKDHARYAVAGESYPAAVPERGAGIDGVLYFDVSPADLRALDRFEGGEYRRATIAVEVSGEAPLKAGIYLWEDAERLSSTAWDPEAFDMQNFIDTWCPE